MTIPVLPEVRKCTSVFACHSPKSFTMPLPLGAWSRPVSGSQVGTANTPFRLAVAAAPRIPALEAGGRADVELVGGHRLRRPQGQQVLEGRIIWVH